MSESLNSSTSVSRQIYADMKAAFSLYAKNSKNTTQTEEEQEEKVYADRSQITRKAFYDIEKAFPKNIDSENKTEKEKNTQEQQVNNIEIKAQKQERANINNINNANNTTNSDNKVKAKNFSLPKSTDTIIAELKTNGLNKTMTAYQIAEKYGVSYMKAREILDELNRDKNGFVREYKLPKNSTVSYKV